MNKVVANYKSLDGGTQYKRRYSRFSNNSIEYKINSEEVWSPHLHIPAVTIKNLAFALAVTLNIFNIADLITTYMGLINGDFLELNPVILYLFQMSPVLMILFKVSITLFFSILLIELSKLKLSSPLTKGIQLGLILGATISTFVFAITSFHNIFLLLTT